MRGHHPPHGKPPIEARSIPADAGPPDMIPADWDIDEVYPRGCGATCDDRCDLGDQLGLSPRMRGHHYLIEGVSSSERSIPADAGPPISQSSEMPEVQVYPRGCGATRSTKMAEALEPGLSPRMRGHHATLSANYCGAGSIPADAGPPKVPPCGNKS